MKGGSSPGSRAQASFPVDGHVHIYDRHDAGQLLGAAARAFRASASPGGFALGALCLTEDSKHDVFGLLSEGKKRIQGWDICATGESESLYVVSEEGSRLAILSGFQAVTREGLEVLALATAARPEDRRSLGDTVDGILGTGGLPVLPWAFGKWWFGRRGHLSAYLGTAPRPRLLLGDNAGRVNGLPGPDPDSLAKRFGLVVLPGSDPLPLSGHEERAGGYGFLLDGDIDPERPAHWFREAVLRLETPPLPFGARSSWPRFLSDQLRLRREKGRSA